jgi:exopolyphosphatase / guanosine-5'-triphosphate,3'-diphosphate pyrophosphatase
MKTLNGPVRIVAFMDIGTNSIRLYVVRISPNLSWSVLTRQKQVVRLGEGEFGDDPVITPEAMDRAVQVCHRFHDLARAHGATEHVTVATSAIREAENRGEILDRLRGEADLEVHPISGKEEARLTYLGVASGMELPQEATLFIDVGGGSTEMVVGDRERHHLLESLKLGAIRMTSLFFQDHDRPIPKSTYTRARRFVRNETVRALQKVKSHRVVQVVGTSGTIMNLAEIADRREGLKEGEPGGTLTYPVLKEVIRDLSSLPLSERKKVAGINPERADIIVGGAVILETLMAELEIPEIRVSSRGLQDGLLADYLSRLHEYRQVREMGVRERSVLQLGRACGLEEQHAATTRSLALDLFDSAGTIGLHPYGERERELLAHAAYLHDIGKFISYANHHSHSYYIVRNADLLGFDDTEVAIMAHVVRYHRKKFPGGKNQAFEELDPGSRKVARTLAFFLRVAESLDRTHLGLVRSPEFLLSRDGDVRLCLRPAGDCQLELWALEPHEKAFVSLFGRNLVVEVDRTDHADLAAP